MFTLKVRISEPKAMLTSLCAFHPDKDLIIPERLGPRLYAETIRGEFKSCRNGRCYSMRGIRD